MEFNNEPINIFDFDGTLTTETWPKFWVWVRKFGYNGERRNDELEAALAEYRSKNVGNELETFFGFFNDLLVEQNDTISYDELMQGEQYIEYNPGVIDFIEQSIAKNYIISGGLREFLQKLKISKNFSGIYGTSLKHNENGEISGIGEVMSDDKKIIAIQEILKNNNRDERDCRNVYYIGDGYSDAAAMMYVHNNGGKVIFVHQPNQDDDFYAYNKKIYEMLNINGMIDFCCVADYRKGSALFEILQRNNENLKK